MENTPCCAFNRLPFLVSKKWEAVRFGGAFSFFVGNTLPVRGVLGYAIK